MQQLGRGLAAGDSGPVMRTHACGLGELVHGPGHMGRSEVVSHSRKLLTSRMMERQVM